MNEPADIDLVRSAKAGNLSSFEGLVSRYERQVYTLALRMLRQEQDAEDVTQEAFLSAMTHLDGFREEASFATWIFRIATHAALKIIRKRKGLETVPFDPPTGSEDAPLPHPEYIADWSETPDHLAHRHDIRELLDRELEKLDEKLRLVFLLRDYEGLSVRETAEALGISEANVKVRLLRARLQLREALTRVLGDPARALAPHRH